MTRNGVAGILAIAVGPFGWCLALGAVLGVDPMLSLEIAGGVLVGLWAAFVVREIQLARCLTQRLTRDARQASMFGVSCWVTPSLRTDAMVVGTFRPRIYVGVELVEALSDDEMRAVLFHEDHHRRTRAPVRAAALEAWMQLLGRSNWVRGALLDRLSDLEALADADAILRGSTPGSLARALLKGDVSLKPASFAYAAERRVEQLLDRASGVPVETGGRLPFEWLPVILITFGAIACHIAL